MDLGPGRADVARVLSGVGRRSGRLVVVEGAPGTGRTSTLRALVATASTDHDRTAVLLRCRPTGSGFAWGVARQLLDALDDGLGDSPADGTADGPDDAGPWSDPGGMPAEVHRYLQRRVAEHATRRPLVVGIDDAHWCDVESLRFLAQLAGRLDHVPVVLAVAADPVAPSGVGHLLTELVDDPARVRLRLAAMDVDEVAERCRRVLGDDGIAAACHEATGGVPALVTAVLDAAAVDGVPAATCGPRPVAAAALARAAAHDDAVADALQLLSVLDSPVPTAAAATMLGRPAAVAADAVAVLALLGCATVSDGTVAVTPPVVRRAVRQAMAPSARHVAELRAVAVLAAEPDGADDAARHLLDVFPEGDASHLQLLRASADRMLARGRYPDAVRLLRRALDEPVSGDRRAELLAGLGTAELYQHTPSAAQHLEVALAGSPSDGARLAWTLQLAHALASTGKAAEAREILDAELDRAAPVGLDLIRRAAAEMAFIALSSDDVLADRRRDAAARTRPRRAGRVENVSRAYHVLSAAFECRPATEVTGRIHQALSTGPEPADQSAMMWLVVASILTWADRPDTAQPLFDRAAAEAGRWHAPMPRYTASWLGGLAAWFTGDVARARALTADALAAAGEREWDVWRIGPAIPAFAVAEDCSEAFAAPAPRGVEDHDDLPSLWVADLALAARGRWKVTNGQVEAGLADLLTAGRRLTAIGCLNPAMAPWRSGAAVALTRLGRGDEARPLADEEVRLARAWGAGRALAVALTGRAEVRGGRDGLADTEEAAGLLADDRFPVELTRTLLVRGTLLRAARDHDRARDVLGDAHRRATDLGTDRLLGRVRDELIAVGGRPRVPRADSDGPLTDGELRVATFAAAGSTNEEIAARLYLARRTVEAHLTNAYRKLGISGRAQLPDELRRRGLDGLDGLDGTDDGDATVPAGTTAV